MNKTLYISLFKHFGETLNTRESAKKLFNIIQKEQIPLVELDFSDVSFVSRSFADQFHKEREILRVEMGLFVSISNAEENIRVMLKTVETTQSKKNRFYREVPVFRFSSKEKLSDYLMSI